ncbi:MAG: hypothetical protein Q9159_001022 [Coniocarpon cinnabarinum]
MANDKHREIAVHHAQLLQQRKDVEAANLAAIEELMHYPTDGRSDTVHPSASDVARFRDLVRNFQPSDYAALFEERNCLDRCGFLSGKQVDMWCSDACARRALYIKVQLNAQPAWERIYNYTQPIELFDEGNHDKLETEIGQHRVGDADDDKALDVAMQKLAIERGEATGSVKKTTLANDIKETPIAAAAEAPNEREYAVDAIDGYVPKKKHQDSSSA